MAKGILNISNYSGGLNNKTNSRDIEDNQFQDLDSLSIETPGKLKVMGAAGNYNPPATTGNLNAEINLGNGLFHFNADHDIDDTNGTFANTEMLFINTDVTSDGVQVFNLNSGNLAYGTKTIPYGNIFSPVIYSAVDGVVRVTPTSFANNNTPKKLEYIDEVYNLGFTYTPTQTQINQAETDFKVTKTEWQVFDAKPADSTGVIVYLNGPLTSGITQGVKDTTINVGTGSGIIGSASVNVGTNINVGTGNGAKFNNGDLIQIDTEIMKITSIVGDTLNIKRGFYGTTPSFNHSTSSNIFLLWTDNNGRMRNVGYADAQMATGGTILGIPEETNHRGNFYFNFYAGTKKDDGTYDNDTGQFFSDDDKVVNIFHEIVYTDNQKSNLVFNGSVTNACGASTPNNIKLNAQMWGVVPEADNIKAIKFYYNETDSLSGQPDAERNTKFLLFEIDFRKGLRYPASDTYNPFGMVVNSSHDNKCIYHFPTTQLIVANGLIGALNLAPQVPLDIVEFKNKPETTRAESYVEQNKHIMGMQGTGYKASTIANRRLYIGNVRYKDAVSEKLKIANDTILKSNLNAFDTFSFENRIDVEINDGDDIIALESLGSKLLEFKRNHLYIINIARDIEFLEATLEYKGCEKDYHVVRGEGFIAWFNKFGFYLYDGKQVRDLLLDKKGQQRLVWSNYYHENNIIGYDPDERTIVIANKNQKIVSFDMKAFALYYRSKGFEAQDTTNFITNNAGDILWFSKYNGTNVELRKWNTSPSKLDSFNINEIALKTKEFTFGKPSVDKKIISVYLSYKNGDGITLHGFRDDGEEEILATLDGNSEVNFKTLHIPIRKAKTEFVDKKAFDKIKGFGLRFSGSDVATDFEVNDIQIVFREKSVK